MIFLPIILRQKVAICSFRLLCYEQYTKNLSRIDSVVVDSSRSREPCYKFGNNLHDVDYEFSLWSLFLYSTMFRYTMFVAQQWHSLMVSRGIVYTIKVTWVISSRKGKIAAIAATSTRQYVRYPSWRCTVNGTLWNVCSTAKMTI